MAKGRFGTLRTPGSDASRAFKGLGDMRKGMLHDTVPVVLGGGLGLGTFLGIRATVKPFGEGTAAQTPSGAYKWAPLIGMGVGAVVGGLGSYFLAGKGEGGTGAGVAAALSSLIAVGGVWGYERMLLDQAPTDRDTHFRALDAVAGEVVAPPASESQGYIRMRELPHGGASVDGLGEIMASESLGQGRPYVRQVRGVNQAAYGSSY
jgi:hypothetical protein